METPCSPSLSCGSLRMLSEGGWDYRRQSSPDTRQNHLWAKQRQPLIDHCPYDKDESKQSQDKRSDSYHAGKKVAQNVGEGNLQLLQFFRFEKSVVFQGPFLDKLPFIDSPREDRIVH